MSRKHVHLGGLTFGIPSDGQVKEQELVQQVRDAMETGTTVDLLLLDDSDKPVRVLFNGRTLNTVIFDLDLGPKPSEIAG
ncbi:MAG TPA: hypothetical protein VFC00_15825 [Micromonosporaceae bacterium]|nr:hypothetical protein [Micromonosporaceae bacterium]